MTKILGLDLGVSSIGWALVDINKSNSQNNKILGLGSRIIPLSADEKDAFEKGLAQTKNKDRTLKRSARRNHFRYKLRREFLRDKLNQCGMLPDASYFKLTSIELYGLRSKAINEKISLQELGRVLLHINQKRGFRSSRKDKSEETNKSEYKQAIEERNRKLDGSTIGQYFYSLLKQDPKFRIKKNIYYRANYVNELNEILNKQSEFYPDIITSRFIEEIRDEIIFYQRKLKSQKHLIGGCEFESRSYKNKSGQLIKVPVKVCPVSSPLFQESKIWQTINNIQIKSIADNSFIELEDEMRYQIYDYVYLREKTNWEQILKQLGISKNEYRTNVRKEITGDATRIAIHKVIKEFDISLEEDFFKLDPNDPSNEIENHKVMRLWHILYSIEDPEETTNALMNQFGFKPELANKLSEIKLKDGFGNLSSKALKKILPHLKKGNLYSDACSLAGYNHSNSETKEIRTSKELKSIDQLALVERGSLRNPAVERILNHLINLVKDIYNQLGAPEIIRIELARELKQNAEQRNRTFRNNNQREKTHDKIREELSNYSLFSGKRISNRDIEKYKLWEEFDKRSPYQPNKEISLAELFSNDYEVEHIIPKARLFDDSFANKCISHVRDNRDKGNETAFDFMKQHRASLFEQYCHFIQDFYKRNEKINKVKFERLMTTKENIPQDFISRQLRETQYITKKAKEILNEVNREVWITSGSVTDYLRHIWGYDNIIHDLHFPAYKEIGQIEQIKVRHDHEIKTIDKIINWSKRLDHRHHAVDALVVSCTDQSMIQSLNTLNQYLEQGVGETRNEALKRSGRKFEAPFSTHSVSQKVEEILISFKPGKKVGSYSKNKVGDFRIGKKHLIPRGSLHEETVYGKNKYYEKLPISKLKENDLERIVSNEIRLKIQNHIDANEGQFKAAFSKKGLENFIQSHPKCEEISLFKYEFVTRYALDQNFKVKDCDSIIDLRVQKIVRDRLALFGDNPKEAFKEIQKEENRLWLDRARNLFVEKVTCKTGLNDLEWASRGFVKSGNNHHIAIYEDANGQLNEVCVSFWEAFERKKQGGQVIEKTHPEFGQLKISMQQNEMFVFGLEKEQLEKAIKSKYNSLISNYLYRVQKIASKDYVFRKHSETNIDDSTNAKLMNKFIRVKSLGNMKGIKVKINRIGEISLL